MRTTSLRAATVAAAGALLLAGCSSGPADVTSGSYRAMAASDVVGSAPDVALTVSDRTFTFRPAGAEPVTATSAPGSGEFVLCPPDTTGTPSPLGAAMTLGTAAFQRPAVFGDCGQTSPKRITVVDLTSASTDVTPFPFTRWIEFCDTTDPDC